VENAGLENAGPKVARWHLPGRKMEDRKMQDWKMKDLDNKRTFKNDWPCNNASTAFRRCTGTVWPFEVLRIIADTVTALGNGCPLCHMLLLIWYCGFLPDVNGRCLSFCNDMGTSANILLDFIRLSKRLLVSFYCY